MQINIFMHTAKEIPLKQFLIYCAKIPNSTSDVQQILKSMQKHLFLSKTKHKENFINVKLISESWNYRFPVKKKKKRKRNEKCE